MSAAYLMRKMQKRGGRSRDYVKAEDLALGNSERQSRSAATELKKELSDIRRKRSRAHAAAATGTSMSSSTSSKRKKSKKNKKKRYPTSSSSSSSTASAAEGPVLPPTASGNTRVQLFGCSHFRQAIVAATLSGRSLRLENIRHRDERPGLRPFEANFLRIVDKLTNGSHVEINSTGTTLVYRPGIVHGGRITHDCGLGRAVGYFIEGLLPLCFFAKEPVTLTLRGITNDNDDLSVDTIRSVLLPTIDRAFGIADGRTNRIELKIKKRGAPPKGGGEVIFTCPVVKELRPLVMVDPGFIKKIRGIAYSTRVSPQSANRMVTSARSLLNNFVPDVFIYTDHYKGEESGKSPGFGCALVAETTEGVVLSAEKMAVTGKGALVLPEDVGLEAAQLLCEEIAKGGCVDTSCQSLMLLLMVLTPESVSKIRLGKLSNYTVQYLRNLRSFFGITFKVKPDHKNGTVLLSCFGTGFKNFSRKVG